MEFCTTEKQVAESMYYDSAFDIYMTKLPEGYYERNEVVFLNDGLTGRKSRSITKI